MKKKIVIGIFTFCLLIQFNTYCQNIIIDVKGNVKTTGNSSQPVRKGDNLKNATRFEFQPDTRYPRPEVKLLTPKGICVIRYSDYQSRPQSELFDFIKLTIHANSVATLGTRSFELAPSPEEQVRIIDSLCKQLNANEANIDYIVSTYINPYCVSEFKIPAWKEIGNLLLSKYSFNFYTANGNTLTADQYSQILKIAKVSTRAFLPASFSLKKYCPIPGNQGNYGTCVGWSTAYGARTISWAIKNNDTVTSNITNQAFSPTFIYEQIKSASDPNCSNGASLYSALRLLKKSGVPFYSDLGFSCNADVSSFTTIASKYAIKDFQALTKVYGLAASNDEFKENLQTIKNAIAEKKPVLASIKCYSSFGGQTWNGLLDVDRGGHAVCIIGYDDNFSNGEGAVEILNSWGPYWGNGGFIYVKYADLKNILNSAIALYDDSKPAPLIPPVIPEVKKDTLRPIKVDTTLRLSGSLNLLLNDGTTMPIQIDEAGTRGLKLAQVDNMTYNVANSYPSGTLFKIKFTSNQPAYVYVIGTDAKKSPLSELFPDPEANISALLDFKSEVAISIPEGNQYIQMDENPGEDYLCVIYSKQEIDVSAIKETLAKNPTKSFVKIVKESLGDKIVDDKDIVFEKNKIAFKSASNNKTAVPVFIKIKHK